jgi:outer membrane receptor protein involved in Fe transport
VIFLSPSFIFVTNKFLPKVFIMFNATKINLVIASLFSVTAFAADLTTDKIEVISTTPLHGNGINLNQVPSNVQTANAKDIKNAQSFDLTDYMTHNLNGVYVNEIQNNPLQPDLNYRGFTASPLLGTPQGLSIYMDGVRMNQPFGDVVSWDLIPKNAIQNMQLMPGSNPLFGLNTLGGAISIQTKDGRSSPGTSIETTFGSYARKIVSLEHGGVANNNAIDYYFTGSFFDENGWRKESDSRVGQLFGKLGWHNDKTDLKFTYSYSDSDLNGNGLVPQYQLANNKYSDVFTYPDNTKNKSSLLNLQFSHFFNDKTSLTGNAYYKRIKSKTYNADLNQEAFGSVPGGYGQTMNGWDGGAGYYPGSTSTVHTKSPYGDISCKYLSSAHDEAGEKCPGLINRSSTLTNTIGLFSQLNAENKLFNLDNQYVVGGGYEHSNIDYKFSSEYADIFSRTAVGYGTIAQGVDQINHVADNRSVDLRAINNVASIFGTDTLNVTNKLSTTISGRYNYTTTNLKDKLNGADGSHLEYGVNTYWDSGASAFKNQDGTLASGDATSDSLAGKHKYHRFNPSAGLTYALMDQVNFFGGYNEGSRAPTAVELGCANPDSPCKLPNAMATDPDLKQVVSKTWEGGVRGRFGDGYRYSATVFDTVNHDDIMFVSTGASSGYFKNFGQTERKGFEGAFSGKIEKLKYAVNYTYLDATYQSSETLPGSYNNSGQSVSGVGRWSESKPTSSTSSYNKFTPTARDIAITPGNKIPLIPTNILKLSTAYDFNDQFSLGGDAILIDGSFVRGNENNQHQPGTVSYSCADAITASGAKVSSDGTTYTDPSTAQKICGSGTDSGTFRGAGKTAGYGLVNLFASYKPHSEWTIFGRVNNVFDKEYYTAGTLGSDPFSSSGNIAVGANPANKTVSIGDTLVAPGAPRSAWIGVRWEFGGAKKSSASD